MKSWLKFLSRNKLFTAIEAVGLIISLAFVLLIGSYVVTQYKVAYENHDHDRIYAVQTADMLSGAWGCKDSFKSQIPEVEAATRVGTVMRTNKAVTVDGNSFTPMGGAVDEDFFDIFPYYGDLTEGSLDEFGLPGKCLVSESFARKITRSGESAVGKVIEESSFAAYEGERPWKLEVIGVYKDFRNTLMLPHDILVNAAFDKDYDGEMAFASIGRYTTILKAIKGCAEEELQEKVNAVGEKDYDSTWGLHEFPLIPLKEVFFASNQSVFSSGNKDNLRMLVMVVLLLLVCSVINYVNLNLALSGKRAKEMATRRLVGAGKGGIVLKYIAESVTFTLVCTVLALLLAKALLPTMDNLISGMDDTSYGTARIIHLNMGLTAKHIACYLLAAAVIGVIVGIAPALFASKFAPIYIVRGNLRRKSKMLFSKLFIIFQNAIAVILIAMALLMEAQMRHMVNRPTGANTEGLYYLQASFRDYDLARPLIDKLMQLPQVEAVGRGSGIPGDINMSIGIEIENGDDGHEEEAMMKAIVCDSTFFRLLGIEEVHRLNHPIENSIWFSESMAKAISFADSMEFAYQFEVNGANAEWVSGIYGDFTTEAANAGSSTGNSGVIVGKTEDLFYCNGLLMKVSGSHGEVDKAIRAAVESWSKEGNGTVVDYKCGYVKDYLATLLAPTRNAMRLIELFTILSVIVSLLGLVAMSSYYSDENTKDIAIRKVFGSEVSGEILRSVKSYMLLIAISGVIGIPMAVYVASKWIARFEYRVSGYWWVFVAAVAILALIAFVSVLWQVSKAAHTDPAIELKKE